MRFLKGLVLWFLGFLLFLSLSTFSGLFVASQTITDPDFIGEQVDRLDLASLLDEMVKPQMPQERDFATGTLSLFYGGITDLEPELKEAAKEAIHDGYDYLLGRSEQLRMVIPLESLKQGFRDKAWQAFQESPPPGVSALPGGTLEQYFEQSFQPLLAGIPDTFEIDESKLPPEIAEVLPEVRRYISYYQIALKVLPGLMVLLVLGIFLINRDVRKTTRSLGTRFLFSGIFYGIPAFGGGFIIERWVMPSFAGPGLPPALQDWMSELSSDLLAPLQVFAIAVVATGVVLLIISFLYRRTAGEERDSTPSPG